MKRNLSIALLVLLIGVAVSGWMRKPAPASNNFAAPTVPAVYRPGPSVADNAQLTPVATRRARRRRGRRVVVRRRKFSHSAAIVGGSAGAGAAIGALAGGGKGAAIGALAGGGAGLVYDRKTHKKTVPVE